MAQSGLEEPEEKLTKTISNSSDKGNGVNGNGKSAEAEFPRHAMLYRTESAACQDELFNPANFEARSSQSQQNTPVAKPVLSKISTSPTANLVNDRIQTANCLRARSPTKDVDLKESPFRADSELAPPVKPPTSMPSAASLRQRQKAQADRREYEAHRPVLRREPTKTMSPRDAVLDGPSMEYDKSVALFDDAADYVKHYDSLSSGTTSQGFNTVNQNIGGFRAVDLSNFLTSPVITKAQSEKIPDFVPQLLSMESSTSDIPAASSQGSVVTVPPITQARKISAVSDSNLDYKCTVTGCSKHFRTPAELHQHRKNHARSRRDTRSPEEADPTTESENDSSEADTGSAGSKMSPQELQVRNSQAGPHRCDRVNPTTGKPCNVVFSRPYDLTRHEDTIHSEKKKKVHCDYCTEEKSFSRYDALTRHMRVVHPEIEFHNKRPRRE